MIDFSALLEGSLCLLSWNIFAAIVAGVFLGVVFGAIPGFTSSMGVAILIPITYVMPPLPAMVLLCSTYAGSVYGGSITAILINAPGTPASAATTFDGFPMTLQGKANEALGLAIIASVIGGAISYFLMLTLMYPIARFALAFGSPEMFMLAIFGLTIIGSVRKESFSKCFLAGLFGLLLSTVGISPTGSIRAYFGVVSLLGGMPIVPAIIGLLAFSELIDMATKEYITDTLKLAKGKYKLKELIKGMVNVFKYPKTLIRASLIGTFIGAVPAAGGDIASLVAYNQEKQSSKDPSVFGQGASIGVIAAEAANNASTGGSLITMISLGIPGSGTTAIMLGALMLHGMRPGPGLFMEQMPLVYGIIISLFLSQLVLIIAGVSYSYTISEILRIPAKALAPTIAFLCIVGSFSIYYNLIDAQIMFAFGIVGYLMKKYGYPVVACVLGVILGPIADSELIRTYIRYRGDFTVFLTRPISLGLIIISLLSLVMPLILRRMRKNK